MMHFDQELDTRGRTCPLPILQAKKALNRMSSRQVLRVVASDPNSVNDFAAFAKQTGNELLLQTMHGEELYFWLRRK